MKSLQLSATRTADSAKWCTPCTAFFKGVSIGAATALSDWTTVVSRCAIYVVLVFLLNSFWRLVLQAPNPASISAPAQSFGSYIVVTECIALSVPAIHIKIRNGVLDNGLMVVLVLPREFLTVRLSESCGEMLVRLVTLGGAGSLALMAWEHSIRPLYVYTSLAVVTSLGAGIGFLVMVIVGLTALWNRLAWPAALVAQKLNFLCGGVLAPITLYPDLLYKICKRTPFASEFFEPGRVVFGVGSRDVLHIVGSQIGWIVILGTIIYMMWLIGIRKVLRDGY